MVTFDDKTIRNFEKYLKLQQSGEINMVSPQVQDMLGISKEEHHFILNNYASLLEEFNSMKVVDEVIADAKARVAGTSEKEPGLEADKSVKTVENQQQ